MLPEKGSSLPPPAGQRGPQLPPSNLRGQVGDLGAHLQEGKQCVESIHDDGTVRGAGRLGEGAPTLTGCFCPKHPAHSPPLTGRALRSTGDHRPGLGTPAKGHSCLTVTRRLPPALGRRLPRVTQRPVRPRAAQALAAGGSQSESSPRPGTRSELERPSGFWELSPRCCFIDLEPWTSNSIRNSDQRRPGRAEARDPGRPEAAEELTGAVSTPGLPRGS